MPRSFRHLDLSERVFIETQLSHGRRPAVIAADLRRARSTITREIRRNGWRAKLRKGSIAGGYRSVAADRRARVLSVKARRPRKLKAGNQLWMTMLRHLRRGLSRGRLRAHWHVLRHPARLSHEATTPHCMPCHGDSSAPACWICCAADTRRVDRRVAKTGAVTPFPA